MPAPGDKLPRVLDIGCGVNKQPGAWGIDIVQDLGDQQFDLNTFPWPVPTGQFLVVYATQTLEHLNDRVRVMEEIWRVCQHGALVFITVPDGVCPGYVQDPTHASPWNVGTFLYFCPEQFIQGSEMPPYHFKAKFHMIFYYLQREPGRTPWGAALFADNLTVVLQAIKE